jgi:DNA replication protein DnaC
VRRSADSSGQIEYRTTLADRIGGRARSRLFEMCRVVKMPLVEDYRLRKTAAM